MKTIQYLLFAMLCSISLNAQNAAPDFTYDDINGNTHSLYADYLDQGIPVVMIISAAWGPWDFVWHESNYMEDFYQAYGPDVQVLHMEVDPSTGIDDLNGTTAQSAGDFITGTGYPIIDVPDDWFMNTFQISYFPSMMLVCPGGEVYSDFESDVTTLDGGLFYGDLLDNPYALEERLAADCGFAINRSILNGFVYDDENDNCDADTDEAGFPGFAAHVTGPNYDVIRYSNFQGNFFNLIDSGTYTINVTGPNGLWNVCNTPQTIEASNSIDTFDFDFGAQAIIDCPYPVVGITSPALIRCFDSYIYAGYCNSGTTTAEDASLEITLDPFLTFVNSTPAPTSQNGDVLTYDLGDVGVGECGGVHMTVNVSCDADTAQVHCFSAQFYPDTTCLPSIAGGLAFAEECQANVGSWDPNDKRGFPMGVGPTNDILPNTPLKYQIRFQNEGTYYANKVVIEDELPEELDLSTFRIGQYSHPCVVEIEGRVLRITYEGINLPWSDFDEPASHGFFNFYINQNEDLLNGTQIWNDAAIYFDFNEAVITNNHLYTINDMLTNNNTITTLDFSVQPNPARDVLNIFRGTVNTEDAVQVQLRSINGQVIKDAMMTSTQLALSLDGISNGMYYVELTKADGSRGVQKVVVAK
ncbi:MAG: T9SS type A sorting domain-containing protein [Saprospiraceae bacterium]